MPKNGNQNVGEGVLDFECGFDGLVAGSWRLGLGSDPDGPAAQGLLGPATGAFSTEVSPFRSRSVPLLDFVRG